MEVASALIIVMNASVMMGTSETTVRKSVSAQVLWMSFHGSDKRNEIESTE